MWYHEPNVTADRDSAYPYRQWELPWPNVAWEQAVELGLARITPLMQTALTAHDPRRKSLQSLSARRGNESVVACRRGRGHCGA